MKSFMILTALIYVFGRVSSLNAKAWQSVDGDLESNDFPETPYLLTRSNTAIGFSGGGSRAYVAALGQISALNELGLLEKIKYMGGISGGSWAVTVVTYAQNVTDIERFLGDIIQPQHINREELNKMNPECARKFAGADLVAIILWMLKNRVVESVAEAWAAALQVMYLDPVRIPKGLRFSWNAETVENIKIRNPDLRSARFLLPLNGLWPYPLIGTTLVGPTSNAPYGVKNHNYTRLDITPLYVGQMATVCVVYRYLCGFLKRSITIGGAVETFAFARNGKGPYYGLPDGVTSTVISNIPDPQDILDLQSAIAASSYAPGAFAESIPLGVSDSFGMHFNYWSPTHHTRPTNYDMLLADGGSLENIPLISFLQRKVKNIILFLNYDDPLQTIDEWDVETNSRKFGQISDALPAYFGIFIEKASVIFERSYDYSKNQVYAESEYAKVVQTLQKAQKEGNGIIATMNLTTIRNENWGIPDGFTSQITFVYLGRLLSWENKLSQEMRALVQPTNGGEDLGSDVESGPFSGFPHYTTLAGGINSERANLLSNMVGWSVLENRELFKSLCE